MSIIVKVKKCIEPGIIEAPSISDPLVVTEAMAVQRGKRFLEDPTKGSYFITKQRSIKVPHDQNVDLGDWPTINSAMLNLVNKQVKVTSHKITLTAREIWATLDTETYERMA